MILVAQACTLMVPTAWSKAVDEIRTALVCLAATPCVAASRSLVALEIGKVRQPPVDSDLPLPSSMKLYPDIFRPPIDVRYCSTMGVEVPKLRYLEKESQQKSIKRSNHVPYYPRSR